MNSAMQLTGHDLQADLPLRGELVDVRLFRPDDITDAYVAWLNDPVVVRYSNQRFRTHDRHSCTAYLSTFAGSDNLFLGVRRRDTGQAIGTMTVYFSRHHRTADVGIMIGARDAWGRGYGQDAWSTVVNWLADRPGMRKVTAGALASNAPMIRLMERSGMAREAVRPRQELVDGEPVDIVLYARHCGT